MADHIISLSDDEEAALTDIVTRSQDEKLTVDSQLNVIVHRALIGHVDTLISRQADGVHDAYLVGSS
jgi:hypothetical protein